MECSPERTGSCDARSAVELVYELATAPPDEARRTLPALCEQLGCRGVGISVREGSEAWSGHTIVDVAHGTGVLETSPWQHLVLDDPIPYGEMEVGKVYRSEELVDASALRASAFHRELLGPAGYASFACTPIDSPDGRRLWIFLFRGIRQGAFEETDIERFRALLPHLALALRLRNRLEENEALSDGHGYALEGLRIGVFVVDADANVLRSNRAAERLVAEHAEQITLRGRRLHLSGRSGRELREILRSLLTGESSSGAEILSLPRPGAPPLGLLVRPCPRRDGFPGRTPRAIVYMSDPATSSMTRDDLVGELFGLSPAEARLAAHVAAGFSLIEAADRLGLSEASARTYSKRIYSKVGVGRQADLVRLLLRSVALLTAPAR